MLGQIVSAVLFSYRRKVLECLASGSEQPAQESVETDSLLPVSNTHPAAFTQSQSTQGIDCWLWGRGTRLHMANVAGSSIYSTSSSNLSCHLEAAQN